MNSFRTNLNASVNIKPKGSQSIVFLLTIAFIVCLVAGFVFTIWDKNYWPPFGFAGVLLLVVVILWLRSHRDIDTPPPPPTNIVSADGTSVTSISTDSNLVSSIGGIEGLSSLLSIVVHRMPLPEPDGLVDNQGKPIPQTESEARDRVETANKTAVEIIQRLFPQLISREKYEKSIEQDLKNKFPDSERNLGNETNGPTVC